MTEQSAFLRPTSRVSVQELDIRLTNLICWFAADELLLSAPMKGGREEKTGRLHQCHHAGFQVASAVVTAMCIFSFSFLID